MAQEHKHTTINATGCGFDFHSKKIKHFHSLIFLLILVMKQRAALNSGAQRAIPPEFGEMWGTEEERTGRKIL